MGSSRPRPPPWLCLELLLSPPLRSTGWHLVDGRERIICVEGLAEGAMKIVKGIAEVALEDPRWASLLQRQS